MFGIRASYRIALAFALAALIPAAPADGAQRKTAPQPQPAPQVSKVTSHDLESLRLAIADLTASFESRYARGREYSRRLTELEASARRDDADLGQAFQQLRQAALLANPLLDFDRVLLLKRKRGQLGLPVNHKCNAGIAQNGYDNEIAVLSPLGPQGRLQTLYRPPKDFYVGEIDLHYDGDRLLFTMPNGKSWQIHEIRADGGGLRQVSRGQDQDVDNFDACYLPDGAGPGTGRIIFASTASYHAVPCWHGKERACAIYSMAADGGGVRQLCFDQDLDLHPAVLPTGQVVFSRWDYTGPMHIYLRPLMAMNPDGTGQRAIYGSNSYWPNALYYPRGIPGAPGKMVTIVAGYHGVPRMGELAVLDINQGSHQADGVVQRIPGRGQPVTPIIRDNLVDDSWPKFLHPWPLSEKYFLVAAQLRAQAPWGIYLVDVFDNIQPLHVLPQSDLFEPIPLRRTTPPPALPDRVDLTRKDALVYLHNVYAGPGLAGVPRNAIKRLRVVAYHFGYPGMAGPDKIGSGGPWEAMRILGTVPVHWDGSAVFRVPANTPLCVQPLDAEGKAVQLMRSWFTAMPGEVVSCVGCHEDSRDVPASDYKLASRHAPLEITPWYGPARGFDFAREVQPVLDRHCVVCHDGRTRLAGGAHPDLRPEEQVENYTGRELAKLGRQRLHPDVKKALGGTKVKYTPAYEALLPYIRRVSVEDQVDMLVPGEYHADTSELIQLLRKGHCGTRLTVEDWDRLVTWIDLNAPCHGSWSEVSAVPQGADRRRDELARLYGPPPENPEAIPRAATKPIAPKYTPYIIPRRSADGMIAPPLPGWPFGPEEARRRQRALGTFEKTVDLGEGVTLKLVRIPAGEWVIDWEDERKKRAIIGEDFWLGACEVTNAQFHRFDPTHDSGRFNKRYQGKDGPGLDLTAPEQPVVRVSWLRAQAFCDWLSQRTGLTFDLPRGDQWEYACRAGTATAFSFGAIDADFSRHANLADKALGLHPGATGGLESNVTAHFGNGVLMSALRGGDILCEVRFDDGVVGAAPVGKYQPNAWGLHDMHGNAAEWTRNASGGGDRRGVRGGSWRDRPTRCHSAFSLSYPIWQRVHNVGFRVSCTFK